MTWRTAIAAAGGLALFLLAMQMMTEGLKAFAGGALTRLLRGWTSTPLRGVLVGILVTGVVQSSSAVTIVAIGFVNAGVLTLRQALGVIFGTNVGTTMTGWLVSLVGFGVPIESFALQILTAGVLLRLAAAGRRPQGLGEALAGFGLFFLGLGILREAGAGAAGAYDAAVATSAGGTHWVAFLALGFAATVLMQSSSAAIAVILTAATSGVVAIEPAAAAVIGANLGTTSTAALAVLRATPAAKRLALGHIGFNLVTGAVAVVLLPVLLWLVGHLADRLAVAGGPAVVLALFHTVFNLLGVALLLPLCDRLATSLERLFRRAEEDLARPQHLDATLAGTPTLAVAALREELGRLRGQVAALAEDVVAGRLAAPAVGARAAAAQSLGAAVVEFVAVARTMAMPADLADALGRSLRVGRYLVDAARRAKAVAAADPRRGDDLAVGAALAALHRAAGVCARLAQRPAAPDLTADAERRAALAAFEDAYQAAKAGTLAAAVGGRIPLDRVDPLLDALSALRRLVEQLVKADRLLRTPDRAAVIEAPGD